jgi:hypothetical protein
VPKSTRTVRQIIIRSSRLLIDNQLSVPVMGFSLTWSLNEISSATISLPLGRDATAGRRSASAASRHVQKIFQRYSETHLVPASFYLTIDGPGWEKSTEEVLVFKGFVAKISSGKQASQVRLIVRLVQDLFQLMEGTCVTSLTTPGSHDQTLAPAIFPAFAKPARSGALDPTTAAQQSLTSTTVMTAFDSAGTILTNTNIQADLWTSALQPFYKVVASSGRPLPAFVGALGVSSDGNQQALAGLDLLTVAPGVPLALTRVTDNENIAQAIREQLTSDTFMGYASQTFWDRLIRSSPSLLYSLVPRASGGYIIPYQPVLGGEDNVYKELTEQNDIEVIDGNLDAPAPIAAVGIWRGKGSPNGTPAYFTGTAQDLASGVYYRSPIATTGSVQFRQGPAWMGKLSWGSGYIGATTGFRKRLVPNGAGFRGQDPAPSENINTGTTTVDGNTETLLRYAQYLWLMEQLRGSYLVLSSPLRFDIAPGSTVKILASPEGFLNNIPRTQETILENSFYGQVSRVTIAGQIGGQNSSGSFNTGYQVNFARTKREHLREGVSLPVHPLYENVWKGGALVDEYA